MTRPKFSTRSIRLISEVQRETALALLRNLPVDAEKPLEIVFREEKGTRSSIQNARMWAMLTDISRQVEWHGVRLTPENWKDMATAALKRQRVVPGIDGGFVVLGTSTSKMRVAEMAEMIEFLFAFGAEKGVLWSDPTLPKE